MIDKHKSQGSLSQQQRNLRRNANEVAAQDISHASVENMSNDAQDIEESNIKNAKGEGYVKSAAGVGIAYGVQKGIYEGKQNVNRSYSLHERRFRPAAEFMRTQGRLEPLVQRHQKISRITVKNQESSYESKKGDEVSRGKIYLSKPKVSGSISIN